MRRLIAFIRAYFEDVIRRVQDGIIARVMLAHAWRGTVVKPFMYHDWAVNLIWSRGCFIFIVGRKNKARLEDVVTLLGTLVRVSNSRDPSMPPFQVVSPSGRFVAWGWRPDGLELSGFEQTLILSSVLGSREATVDWNLN